jgi:hypothetical protein
VNETPGDADTGDGGSETGRTGYDPAAEVHATRHDWAGDRPLAGTIVEALATVTGDDPTALPPLYDAIDPEAIERLFRSFEDENGHSKPCFVEFTFATYAVTVSSSGELTVYEA